MVLDVGCGMGTTVKYLKEKYNINSFGVDPSLKLIELGKSKYNVQNVVSGEGEKLPYNDMSFDGVLAECTMSLMSDYKKTITECQRVLKPNGYFVISDVYARRPEYIYGVQEFNVKSCMRGLFDKDVLKNAVADAGFDIVCFEDWTDLLRQLTVKIIFKYGSMAAFWNVATCESCGGFQEKLSLCKPGYFLLAAKNLMEGFKCRQMLLKCSKWQTADIAAAKYSLCCILKKTIWKMFL